MSRELLLQFWFPSRLARPAHARPAQPRIETGPADSLLRLKRAAEQEHRSRKVEKGAS